MMHTIDGNQYPLCHAYGIQVLDEERDSVLYHEIQRALPADLVALWNHFAMGLYSKDEPIRVGHVERFLRGVAKR